MPPPTNEQEPDNTLGLSWLRHERRAHPSVDEQVGLFRFQIEQVSKRTEENRTAVTQVHRDLCKLIERLNRIESHYAMEEQALKDFMDDEKAHREEVKKLLDQAKFMRWLWAGLLSIGGMIVAIVTALYHGYGILDFLK